MFRATLAMLMENAVHILSRASAWFLRVAANIPGMSDTLIMMK